MRNASAPCGIECKFFDITGVWEFFDFSNVDFGNHFFSVVDGALFSKGGKIQIKHSFRSEYFQELIQQSFVVERLVLHLYPDGASTDRIEDYADFLQSRCEMIILAYDGYYMDIYCKSQTLLQRLLHKAQIIPNTKVCEKYEDTDTREEMYV